MQRSLIALLLTPTLVAPLAAQTASSPLVSVAWLAEHKNDPNLVILHAGPEEAYAAAHIPGAQLVTGNRPDVRSVLRAPEAPGKVLEMPDAAKLKADLESLGISDNSQVVVVFDQEWYSPSTRVLLTLWYGGLGAKLLDGGQAAWVAAGHPVTNVVPTVARGTITPRLQTSLLATVDEVRAVQPGGHVRIIDARAPAFYDGPAHGDHKAGHIPGAVNIPFTSVVGENGLMLSREALADRFRAAGITPGQSLIVYCHIGQQGTLIVTAARLLGYNVRLYDGSFDDWNARNLPVEGGRSGE
jgi:thiosulfate/3-mercaptopyruvate sulfurtransferase